MYLVHHLKCSILTEPSVFLFNPFFPVEYFADAINRSQSDEEKP